MTKLEGIAREVASREGCELYDLEFVGSGQGRILRVYIDKTPGPVGIEDCSNVSKGLNLLLDVEDLIPGDNYYLEVSSPGLERELKRPEHFARAVGEKIWLKLKRSAGQIFGEGLEAKAVIGAKQITVPVLAADAEGIDIDLETQKLRLTWEDIDKAKMVFEFVTGEKKQLNPNLKKNLKTNLKTKSEKKKKR